MKKGQEEIEREEVIAMIRRDVDAIGLCAHSERMGLSAAYIGEVLKGTRNPGPSVLGYYGIVQEKKVIITYRRAS